MDCAHLGNLIGSNEVDLLTCTDCWQRLLFDWAMDWDMRVPVAPPPPPCGHLVSSQLVPIASQIEGRLFAVCRSCACVVTRPDGPGRWADATFYGYLIREEL